MKRVGKLILIDKSWTVFKGHFESNISDSEFNYLASYLRNSLKVHLLEKQPEFVPIWPPVIKTEEGYMVDSKIQTVYGYIVSGNDTPRIYTYREIEASPEEVYSNANVASIRIRNVNTLINIDRKYVSQGTLLLRGLRELTGFTPEIYEVYSDGQFEEIQGFELQRKYNSIRIMTQQPMELIAVRSSGEIIRYSGIGTYAFEGLCNGDLILILHCQCLIGAISIFREEYQLKKVGIDDVKLHALFSKYKYAKKVKVPHRLKIELFMLKEQFTISKKDIEYTLRKNIVSIPLVKVLEDIINEQK